MHYKNIAILFLFMHTNVSICSKRPSLPTIHEEQNNVSLLNLQENNLLEKVRDEQRRERKAIQNTTLRNRKVYNNSAPAFAQKNHQQKIKNQKEKPALDCCDYCLFITCELAISFFDKCFTN